MGDGPAEGCPDEPCGGGAAPAAEPAEAAWADEAGPWTDLAEDAAWAEEGGEWAGAEGAAEGQEWAADAAPGGAGAWAEERPAAAPAPLPTARHEDTFADCHLHPLTLRLDSGPTWACWECGQHASASDEISVRWSCLECGYDLCHECVERMPSQGPLPGKGKHQRPWRLCSNGEAGRAGLPVAVAVRGAEEEWLNQLLLLSATSPPLTDRGCYVYGAPWEAGGHWPYMWWDAKSSKWKLASWRPGDGKGPSHALCRADDQSLTPGSTLGNWTVAKGPRADLALTVAVLSEEELWGGEWQPPLHLADVLGIVNRAAREILSELGEDEGAALDAPLMDLGVDSRRAFQLHEALSSQLSMSLPPTLMFNAPTQRIIAKDIVELSLQ